MIENALQKERCTGCSTCSNSCPYNCITMEENDEGFLYPKVDQEKCKNCKICIKKCPVLNKEDNMQEQQDIIACYSKDEYNRKISSSGGCFGEFSKKILSQNGVVFGVGYDKNLNVIHKYAKDVKELEQLQGSKYVQSNVDKIYSKVKDFLNQDIDVLFSGTPCQIAGLKSFLGKEYDNLYTIDIVCHGVPSQKLFNKYLEKYGNENMVKDVKFRDKTNGWKDSSMKIILKNGVENIKLAKKDDFIKCFLSNICLRESCYNCEFKQSQADITIGDFWGVNDIKPEINDNKGVSILFINTRKGKSLLESCRDSFVIEDDIKKEDVVKHNPCIEKSVKRPSKRDSFYIELNEKSIEELADEAVPKQNILKIIIKNIYLYLRKKR